MTPTRTRPGFTLVELLVVVAIIVVLLALLVPAMDRAIYQTELAVCASRLKAATGGVLTYAVDQRRSYPYRAAVWEGSWKRANWLVSFEQGGLKDDRSSLAPYVKPYMLLDPMCGQGKVDLSPEATDADTYVMTDYGMWWDWGYSDPIDGGSRSNRMGKRWTFQGDSYALLAGDWDFIDPINNSTNSSHASSDGSGFLESGNNKNNSPGEAPPIGGQGYGKFTFAWWQWAPSKRGPIDGNFAYDDGSVVRLNDIKWDEWDTTNRTARVPVQTAQNSAHLPFVYVQVPAR